MQHLNLQHGLLVIFNGERFVDAVWRSKEKMSSRNFCSWKKFFSEKNFCNF